ncbi:helix-turn-helix domain-containing protein [Streptomyces sp. NPDC057376]|uniref:helix-turn-helix domain-containing protein n=1 Tax=unclassified Streptomyces TaxID=2593676 RepID=UPI000938D007|nr:helix-turn-helix transcriptional regulator [Streptomyces sp. CB02414]OKI88568.1 XRE family transcriptional regulator [Streptomyces sp. CB02414]
MAGDDFAGLLRELKERSGLSYGALGKRLHMSASTLHRYVSGEVVPVEFAPVERLARVCRATPEELLELHRRWIRADALRGVKKGEGEGEEQTGGSEEPDPPVAVEEPTPPAPRRRVPRTALYAASGVVAVSVAVALVANLVSGSGDDGRRGPAGAAGAVPPSLSASGSATAPATPSGSASASASPSTSESASPSASATDAGASASPSRRAPADGPMLTVSTTPYYWDSPCDHAFLVDRSPKNVLKPPAQQDAVGWAAAHGAVSANRQTAVLTVQGTGPETVVLEALHVRVVNSGAPLDWNQYVMGNGCGGEVSVKAFDVALDMGNPLAMPIGGQRDFPYSVSESDPEVFHVNAHTSDHDVSWYLELEWSSGGREGTLRVDDHGKPFRTSASKDGSYYAYPLGSDAWERVEGD